VSGWDCKTACCHFRQPSWSCSSKNSSALMHLCLRRRRCYFSTFCHTQKKCIFLRQFLAFLHCFYLAFIFASLFLFLISLRFGWPMYNKNIPLATLFSLCMYIQACIHAGERVCVCVELHSVGAKSCTLYAHFVCVAKANRVPAAVLCCLLFLNPPPPWVSQLKPLFGVLELRK